MSETFLEKIIAKTRRKVALCQGRLDTIRSSGIAARSSAEKHRLRSALAKENGINIIAEIKRASPSRGVINPDVDVESLARKYEAGGAAAISVLTEPEYFHGSMQDLATARSAVQLPILRKDFIVDAYQLYEAASMGADGILLIVAAMPVEELRPLLHLAEAELGLDVLVEVHTREEMIIAEDLGAQIIGINNRDLHTLSVSLDVSRDLIEYRPEAALMVAESGLSIRAELVELRDLGFNGFLVGETLMRCADASAVLGSWT